MKHLSHTKIICAAVCALSLIIFPVGCKASPQKDLEKSPFIAAEQNQDVVLSIKGKTITLETQTITLTYTNKSGTEYSYGGVDFLDVEMDGIWYTVPHKDNVAWDMLAFLLPANGSAESSFPIKMYYEDLGNGKYRIVKKLNTLDSTHIGSYIITEFTVA